MKRKFIFNYDALNSYINEEQKKPDRTAWELKILRNNCKNNLIYNLSNPKEYIIIIDESTWDISINGQTDLQERFYTLPTWYKMNNKDRLYRQVKFALEEAKKRWIYDQIFKEIKDSE
jgi:hypothetical protein